MKWMEKRQLRQQQRLAAFLLADPAQWHYALDLWEKSGIASGAVYSLLIRWVNAGWVKTVKEDLPPAADRQPRRCYSVTPAGLGRLRELVRK